MFNCIFQWKLWYFVTKWYFTSVNFPWEMPFYQWKLSIGNGILPVEIVHRKFHFTSGNLTWEMAFYQWKFSMENMGFI